MSLTQQTLAARFNCDMEKKVDMTDADKIATASPLLMYETNLRKQCAAETLIYRSGCNLIVKTHLVLDHLPDDPCHFIPAPQVHIQAELPL